MTDELTKEKEAYRKGYRAGRRKGFEEAREEFSQMLRDEGQDYYGARIAGMEPRPDDGPFASGDKYDRCHHCRFLFPQGGQCGCKKSRECRQPDDESEC
jgi:hypothetical protein